MSEEKLRLACLTLAMDKSTDISEALEISDGLLAYIKGETATAVLNALDTASISRDMKSLNVKQGADQ